MAQSTHNYSIESENMNDESTIRLPSSHNRIEISRSTTRNADNCELNLPVAKKKTKKSYELPSGMVLSC